MLLSSCAVPQPILDGAACKASLRNGCSVCHGLPSVASKIEADDNTADVVVATSAISFVCQLPRSLLRILQQHCMHHGTLNTEQSFDN